MQHLFPDMNRGENPHGVAGPGVYVRVAVERGIDAEGTGEGLTYRAAPGLSVGQRVEVPLGRGNKRASGIVVVVGGEELLEGLAASRVKDVLESSGAALPARLVELARWMAGYYVCPLGMVLATMLPAAVKAGVGVRTRIVLDPVNPATAERLLATVRITPSARQAWTKLLASGRGFSRNAKEWARALELKTAGPVNSLLRAGLLTEREITEVRSRAGMMAGGVEAEAHQRGPFELTAAQRHVAEGIGAGLGTFGVDLVRGVTGSGKTEVYLHVLERVIARGGKGLVLVPEISLTPQTAGRFVDRFRSAGEVAVLHSGLSAAERHRQWSLAASGRAVAVVGARSAVFAPIQNLGVVIVDEEHAGDYKQDQLPRYHGRDVAIKRAQLEGCPVLLGSATPSLESWANARAGRYRLWELNERVGGGKLPRVEVVDLTRSAQGQGPGANGDGGLPRGSPGGRGLLAIGRRLDEALRATLISGGQAILLLNRRGYSSYVCCTSSACGWVMKCDDCDASLVLHKAGLPAGGVLRCHHCLAEQRVPKQCPTCGKRVIALGAGTQKLENEIADRFADVLPPSALERADGDSMRSAADWFDVLRRFASGQTRVLLGTQMISKGLDFPKVTLVGVINADTGLSLPDFRASERTFQLISQVAGRAGRGIEPGLVIVQTVNPAEPAIRFASSHDYRGFAAHELDVRDRAGLPPATRMARIVVRDPDHMEARARADAVSAALRAEMQDQPMRMLGPAPCPISRIAGQYRFSIELIARRAADIQSVLAGARAKGAIKSDGATAVDVDPVALM